jgi:hypothetical protein
MCTIFQNFVIERQQSRLGSRPGVLLSHGGHLVHITLDDGGGRAVELPWEEGWGSLEGRVVVACAAGSDGCAVAISSLCWLCKQPVQGQNATDGASHCTRDCHRRMLLPAPCRERLCRRARACRTCSVVGGSVAAAPAYRRRSGTSLGNQRNQSPSLIVAVRGGGWPDHRSWRCTLRGHRGVYSASPLRAIQHCSVARRRARQ